MPLIYAFYFTCMEVFGGDCDYDVSYSGPVDNIDTGMYYEAPK